MAKNAAMHRMFQRSRIITAFLGAVVLLAFAGTPCRGRAAADKRMIKMADTQEAIPLRDIAGRFGLKYEEGTNATHRLASRWTDIRFVTGSRRMMARDMLVWLHAPVVIEKKRASMHKVDFNKIIDPLLRPDVHLLKRGDKVVVLDPGHGGRDSGAVGPGGLEEKDVVLDLARLMRSHLVNAGYKVHMTRDSDRFLTLDERTRKAAQRKADIFVSIHLNSSTTRSVRGRETFLLTAVGHPSSGDNQPDRSHHESHPGNAFDEANTLLGYYLHRGLTRGLPADQDRGLKRARFQVLKNAPCPAALIECGFLSNRTEERWFQDSGNIRQMAHTLSVAVMDYMAAVKRAKLATP